MIQQGAVKLDGERIRRQGIATQGRRGRGGPGRQAQIRAGDGPVNSGCGTGRYFGRISPSIF